MISIKHFLERRDYQPAAELLEAALQMSRLLLEAIATHGVWEREADGKAFLRDMNGLLRRMDQPPTALDLLEISSEAVEAMEAHAHRTRAYQCEQNDHMQSIVAMLADTVADLSRQSDLSIARLQAIEQQIEQASEMDDKRVLSAGLQSCLAAIRDAAAQQRKGSSATVQRLQGHIRATQTQFPPDVGTGREIELEPAGFDEQSEAAPVAYVAAFKLQRSEHIAARFGEAAKAQMLSLISQSLKTVLGPEDRLLRWKGTSFVMFLKSAAPVQEVRRQLTDAVARTGQHYVEVGKKTALLSIGVDWIVFPQAQYTSLDAVFNEIDAFLAGEPHGAASSPAVKS